MPRAAPLSPNLDPVAVAVEAEDVLEPAHAALDEADPARACEIALAALADAEQRQDPHRQAKALLLLAHLDRLASRFRAAHGRARQAARLFRTLGDEVGESGALSTLAHASSCLGRNEEAVESALISVHLAEPFAFASHKAMLYNCLGVAYLWSRDFAKAEQALVSAIDWAEATDGLVSAFRPRINQVLVEALGAVASRYRTGVLPSLEKMAASHLRCETLVQRGASAGLFVGGRVAGLSAWLLTSALTRKWTSDPVAAEALLAQARAQRAGFGRPTLGHAYEHWVRAELAWFRNDLGGAAAHCTALVEMAQQLEYEQMACLGYMLPSQIYELLDERAKAFDAFAQAARPQGDDPRRKPGKPRARRAMAPRASHRRAQRPTARGPVAPPRAALAGVARLSGDEFAILFQRADEREATRVCARISAAVTGFAWDGIAPGLRVTVSIGTAGAHAGDSTESLLHRGDSAMYAAKRQAGAGGA